MNTLCLHSPYLVTKCGLGSWQVIVVDALSVIVLMLAQIHRKCWEANLDKGHADWSWTVFREPTACGVGRIWISDHLIYSRERDMLEQWIAKPKEGEIEEMTNLIRYWRGRRMPRGRAHVLLDRSRHDKQLRTSRWGQWGFRSKFKACKSKEKLMMGGKGSNDPYPPPDPDPPAPRPWWKKRT